MNFVGSDDEQDFTSMDASTGVDPDEIRRSRVKALDLLKFSDRSESELRRKLHEKGFTDPAIDDAIAYAYSYHYLDDVRYAENFIRNHRDSYSAMVIRQKLMQKGVDSADINAAFDNIAEEASEDDNDAELNAAVSALRKKMRSVSSDDPSEGQKLLAYMYRKGFTPDITKKALEQLREEE